MMWNVSETSYDFLFISLSLSLHTTQLSGKLEVIFGLLKQLVSLLKPAEALIVAIYNSDRSLVSRQRCHPHLPTGGQNSILITINRGV